MQEAKQRKANQMQKRESRTSENQEVKQNKNGAKHKTKHKTKRTRKADPFFSTSPLSTEQAYAELRRRNENGCSEDGCKECSVHVAKKIFFLGTPNVPEVVSISLFSIDYTF